MSYTEVDILRYLPSSYGYFRSFKEQGKMRGLKTRPQTTACERLSVPIGAHGQVELELGLREEQHWKYKMSF